MLEQLGLIGNTIVLVVSLLILNRASNSTITNSVKIADMTGLGKTTVGFILVAFSTSLPEFFVAIFAIFQPENVGVSVGNVLGSNIVNICLILGICFLIMAWKSPKRLAILPMITKEEMGKLYFGLFVASIIPLSLLFLGNASQFIGIILIVIFVLYLFQLSKVRNITENDSLGEEKRRLRRYTVLACLGAVGVVATAYFIVESASYVALSVGIPRVVIGATIVAFGTSIPELATSIDSVRKGHTELALGNVVGSGFINITFILGITLLASPLRVNIAAFSDLVIFSLIANLILWYFLSSERIGWRESAVLFFIYALFLTVSFSGYRFN
jgi:cation:H+ antiporter